MATIESLLSQFHEAFYADDFPAQLDLHKALKPLIRTSSSPVLSTEYLHYKNDLKTVKLCLKHLKSPEWSTVRESSTIKIESKGSGNNFTTKSTLLINSNIFQVLSVLSEADLVPNWVEPLKEVTIYQQVSKTRYLLKYLFDFPWPLSARHCMLEFFAVPLEKSVAICKKTPTSDKYLGFDVPKPRRGETRMRVNFGCLLVEYLSEQETKLTIMSSCDANISFLPNFIINFGTKHVLYYMMETVREKIMNIQGSVYEERMNKKKEFYDYMRKMIGIYIH